MRGRPGRVMADGRRGSNVSHADQLIERVRRLSGVRKEDVAGLSDSDSDGSVASFAGPAPLPDRRASHKRASVRAQRRGGASHTRRAARRSRSTTSAVRRLGNGLYDLSHMHVPECTRMEMDLCVKAPRATMVPWVTFV